GPPTPYGEQPYGVPMSSGAPESTMMPDQIPAGRARASGGPVSSGQSYLVGERGPEVFVPGSSGTVMASTGSEGLGGSEQKEIIEDETDQRRKLTTNLKQINDL